MCSPFSLVSVLAHTLLMLMLMCARLFSSCCCCCFSSCCGGCFRDCPTYTSALGAQLAQYRGQLTAAVVVAHVLPTVQTGNLHVAVADLTANLWHVSFMRRTTADPTEPEFGYERQFTQLDMAKLFGLAQPDSAEAADGTEKGPL
jgi:hypothetical protein